MLFLKITPYLFLRLQDICWNLPHKFIEVEVKITLLSLAEMSKYDLKLESRGLIEICLGTLVCPWIIGSTTSSAKLLSLTYG